jgi:nucleoside phosphorylase
MQQEPARGRRLRAAYDQRVPPRKPLPVKSATVARRVQLRRAVDALVETFPSIETIHLFGSRRHHTQSLRSDVDLLVRAGGAWLGPGVANQIWAVDPYLDVFAADGGIAQSLANGSRINASDFEELIEILDAVPLWANGAWCGAPAYEVQAVLQDETPVYTLVHPTYVAGAPVLVMCALQQEFDAVVQRLEKAETLPSDYAEGGANVAIGVLQSRTGDEVIVAASLLPRMGNIAAALATLDAIDSVRPYCAVLTGIAAGVRGEVELGDVVVPEVIVGYEAMKVEPGGDRFHGSMVETDQPMIARVKGWDGTAAWKRKWGGERREISSNGSGESTAENLAVVFDALASGEKVLADAERAQRLRELHRKVVAIEMEAAGFSAACLRRRIPFLVMKSISDFADPAKDDRLHPFCCRATADLVASLIADRVI